MNETQFQLVSRLAHEGNQIYKDRVAKAITKLREQGCAIDGVSEWCIKIDYQGMARGETTIYYHKQANT